MHRYHLDGMTKAKITNDRTNPQQVPSDTMPEKDLTSLTEFSYQNIEPKSKP